MQVFAVTTLILQKARKGDQFENRTSQLAAKAADENLLDVISNFLFPLIFGPRLIRFQIRFKIFD